VELLEHVVEVEERTLAKEHPSRLASQHELAGAYQANGQIKQAVELLEHVVEVKERTLAEEHPSRLASQHVLAELLLQMSPESSTPKRLYCPSNRIRLLYITVLLFFWTLLWSIFP
jgi:hypothetical protein